MSISKIMQNPDYLVSNEDYMLVQICLSHMNAFSMHEFAVILGVDINTFWLFL